LNGSLEQEKEIKENVSIWDNKGNRRAINKADMHP